MREYNIAKLVEHGCFDYTDIIAPIKVDKAKVTEVYNEIKKLLEKHNLTFDSFREKGEQIDKEEGNKIQRNT